MPVTVVGKAQKVPITCPSCKISFITTVYGNRGFFICPTCASVLLWEEDEAKGKGELHGVCPKAMTELDKDLYEL